MLIFTFILAVCVLVAVIVIWFWQSAWCVNVYMFIKRGAVQYRRSLELGTDPYVSFTHACRFREDPLLSWTLAENCYAVLSCRVQSSCCCACAFVANVTLGVLGHTTSTSVLGCMKVNDIKPRMDSFFFIVRHTVVV